MKITIVGTGNVGASTCFLLASKNICDEIVITDVNQDILEGKAMDIAQSCTALNVKTTITPTMDYSKIQNSDIVIITAGSPRKPGMSREDLLHINTKIIKEIVSHVRNFAPNSIIIVVSNPLDVMTYMAFKESGFTRNKVIGMGGILDSARMSNVINSDFGYEKSDIISLVIGAHGEEMIPLTRFSTIDNKKFDDLFNTKQLEEIIYKTKYGGGIIVKKLGTSAYYAPASSVCVLVDAIMNDSKQIYPCSVYLKGEYGYDDICIGLPVKIGKNGIHDIINLNLNDDEKSKLKNCFTTIKEMIDIVKKD